MKKGKYEYYNSKLVTSKAEKLRDEFIKEVEELLKPFDYSLLTLNINIQGEPIIVHEFKFQNHVLQHTAKDFYSLYNLAVDLVK